MTPICDVFTAADTHHKLQLAAENHRLRVALATAQATIATLDQRVDILQRANEARESRKWQQRQEVVDA